MDSGLLHMQLVDDLFIILYFNLKSSIWLPGQYLLGTFLMFCSLELLELIHTFILSLLIPIYVVIMFCWVVIVLCVIYAHEETIVAFWTLCRSLGKMVCRDW